MIFTFWRIRISIEKIFRVFTDQKYLIVLDSGLFIFMIQSPNFFLIKMFQMSKILCDAVSYLWPAVMKGIICFHAVDSLHAIEPSNDIYFATQHSHFMPPSSNI